MITDWEALWKKASNSVIELQGKLEAMTKERDDYKAGAEVESADRDAEFKRAEEKQTLINKLRTDNYLCDRCHEYVRSQTI